MKKNKIYILKDRGLLYIQGDDVKESLQNIISNYIVFTMISDEDEIVHITAHPRRRGNE